MGRGLTLDYKHGTPNDCGRIRTQAGTDTPDGAPADFTLSTRQRWRLLAVRFQYACGPVIGTRHLRLEVLDSATTLWRSHAKVTQTAGQIRDYTYAETPRNSTAFSRTEANVQIPNQFIIPPAHTIRIAVTNGKLDDNIQSITYLAEEWIDG